MTVSRTAQNFLWNDFRFARDARWGDRMLPGIPPFYYRAEMLYEHPCGFYFGPMWNGHRTNSPQIWRARRSQIHTHCWA